MISSERRPTPSSPLRPCQAIVPNGSVFVSFRVVCSGSPESGPPSVQQRAAGRQHLSCHQVYHEALAIPATGAVDVCWKMVSPLLTGDTRSLFGRRK